MCIPYRIEISSPYYYNCSLCNVYFEKYIEYSGCNHKFCKSCKKKYNIKYFFGCWTSVQRKKVLPLLEKYNVRLFYSVSYEGLECTNNIYHFGALPNQSLRPCTLYIFSKYDYKDIYMDSKQFNIEDKSFFDKLK